MANGTVYLDASIRTPEGNIFSMGRTLLGQNDTINPEDVGMNLIRSIILQPWQSPPLTFVAGRRRQIIVSGSIGSLESETGNYVRVTAAVIKGTGFVAVGYPGTMYIGTNTGSWRGNYIAAGR